MDVSSIIMQILSAIYSNDLSAIYILSNAFKNVSDTIGDGVVVDPLNEVNTIKAFVNSFVTKQMYKEIIVQSIDSAFEYDHVGCITHIARCLVRHADSVLAVIKEMEMYEVCNSPRGSRKYQRRLSDLCNQNHLLITSAGLQAVEDSGELNANFFVSTNGFLTNCGIARMLLMAMCNGAL
uniref:19.7 kDa protein n=1 Tax=Grapevine leafroll-associated virus 3 TaxID=55951 RepID=A0A0F6NU67_9CLOS|nr:19.7 kDa protein [Grapevine leafroll-associated virus 3]